MREICESNTTNLSKVEDNPQTRKYQQTLNFQTTSQKTFKVTKCRGTKCGLCKYHNIEGGEYFNFNGKCAMLKRNLLLKL